MWNTPMPCIIENIIFKNEKMNYILIGMHECIIEGKYLILDVKEWVLIYINQEELECASLNRNM